MTAAISAVNLVHATITSAETKVASGWNENITM
jgi:hypothetical protein